MTKISLIAIIWVWHSVAYGQLSANIPYYFPYSSTFTTFVTQSHDQQNYDDGTVSGGNGGELLERNSPFQGSIFIRIRRLEAIIANLAKQLKDITAKLGKNVLDLKDEINTKATKDDLAKKADQSKLDDTNTELQTKATKDDLAKKADQLKLDETNTELKTTSNNLATARTELSSTKSDVEDLTIKLNARTSEIVDIKQMPTSCSDLQRMGHKLSGFFSVKGSKKMEMVFCDFNPNQNNKLIGYADVKSAPVHFYVQRESPFSTTGIPIPFQLAVVNEGNAMDLKTGKFMAPQNGIYFFSFTGLAQFPAFIFVYQLRFSLNLNGDRIASGWVEAGVSFSNQFSPLTLQSTLNLKKDDQVWMEISQITSGVLLYDDTNHFTHFTGFVLEEEIVASL